MPRGDRTGPAGVGPMTGRGMGVCAEKNAPDYTMGGGGFGRAMGMGRGFRNRSFARWGTAPQAAVEPLNKMEQIAALKEQRDHIQQQLVTLKEQ